MRYSLFPLILLVGAWLGCGPAPKTAPPVRDGAADSSKDPPTQAEAVQVDVRRLQNALYSGDFAAVIESTNPTIIKVMGGPAQAESDIKKMIAPLLSKGVTIESLTFPQEPTFFSSERHDFVFVPTLTIINIGGQRVESLNFQLGAKARSASKWTYLEGSRINDENLHLLFPDFPAGYPFPKLYRKKL